MKWEKVTNVPDTRIGFAKTHGYLVQEYNPNTMFNPEARFSSFTLSDIFSSKDSQKAKAEAIRSKAELDRALAGAISSGKLGGESAGMSTGAKIGISVGVLAVVGLIIYYVRK